MLTCASVGQLGLRSGAAIVASIAHPQSDVKIRAECQELSYRSSGNDEADAQTISRRCLEFCETVIRENPEHWLRKEAALSYRVNALSQSTVSRPTFVLWNTPETTTRATYEKENHCTHLRR